MCTVCHGVPWQMPTGSRGKRPRVPWQAPTVCHGVPWQMPTGSRGKRPRGPVASAHGSRGKRPRYATGSRGKRPRDHVASAHGSRGKCPRYATVLLLSRGIPVGPVGMPTDSIRVSPLLSSYNSYTRALPTLPPKSLQTTESELI